MISKVYNPRRSKSGRLLRCCLDAEGYPGCVYNNGMFRIALLTFGLSAALGAQNPPTIVLVGDSTMAAGSGWGDGFQHHIRGGAEFVNMARGGRSSRSYRNEGWWQKTMALKPDYVLLQFGHNDQPGKGPERETDPETTFREFMAQYVAEARANGATPILVTSLTRRNFKDGKIVDTLFPYADAVKKLAADEHVPLVDLHRLSMDYSNRLGPAGNEQLGKTDNTHLSPRGSVLIANLVAAELVRVMPELSKWVDPTPE